MSDDRPEQATMSKLVSLVYDELRRIAAARLGQERHGQTLQATALVHEAWIKLAGSDSVRAFQGRTHFMAVAAEAMRCILIDNARRKAAQKHGGGLKRVELAGIEVSIPDEPSEDASILHEAIEQLAKVDARKAELVKLRYFAGLTIDEAAMILHVSEPTVKRDWTFARAWLAKKVQELKDAAHD